MPTNESANLPSAITTNRLLLRWLRINDAVGIFENYSQDIDVARFLTWVPHRRISETISFVSYLLRQAALGEVYPYVICNVHSPEEPIGMIEIRVRDNVAELGFVLSRKYWKKGLMTEAVTEVIAEIKKRGGISCVKATCDVDNRASASLLKRCGMELISVEKNYVVHPNIENMPRDCFIFRARV